MSAIWVQFWETSKLQIVGGQGPTCDNGHAHGNLRKFTIYCSCWQAEHQNIRVKTLVESMLGVNRFNRSNHDYLLWKIKNHDLAKLWFNAIPGDIRWTRTVNTISKHVQAPCQEWWLFRGPIIPLMRTNPPRGANSMDEVYSSCGSNSNNSNSNLFEVNETPVLTTEKSRVITKISRL